MTFTATAPADFGDAGEEWRDFYDEPNFAANTRRLFDQVKDPSNWGSHSLDADQTRTDAENACKGKIEK